MSCELYKELDSCKNFGFKDQLTRSALSIASNIAEGEERETANESARFLYIAKGSALINEAKEISAMLAALIKRRKGSVREPIAKYE